MLQVGCKNKLSLGFYGGTDIKSCQGVKYRCWHSVYRGAQTASSLGPTASLHHNQRTHAFKHTRQLSQQNLILAVRHFKAWQRAFQPSEGPSEIAAHRAVTCIALGHSEHRNCQAQGAAIHSYTAAPGPYMRRKNHSIVSLSPFRHGL